MSNIAQLDMRADTIDQTPSRPKKSDSKPTATHADVEADRNDRTPSNPEISNSKLSYSSPITAISDHEAFAETLALAINTMKLKPAKPTVFYGDPLISGLEGSI